MQRRPPSPMQKVSFLFIALAFLLLPLGALDNEVLRWTEIALCSLLIGSFGVSHGAIDNVLYGFRSRSENLTFIAIYVLAAGFFGLVWMLHSSLAFAVFVLISAYHFGQSQFIDYTNRILVFDRALYLSWGLWLLAAYVYLNQGVLEQAYRATALNIGVFGLILQYAESAFLFSTVLLLALLTVNAVQGRMKLQDVFLELYQLIAIVVVFAISSPLLGFTLYFVILHSIRVLEHEYRFLKQQNEQLSRPAFIGLLLPFTLIALSGLGLFALTVWFFDVRLSLSLISLIFISCLTFPHSFVMEVFYRKRADGHHRFP